MRDRKIWVVVGAGYAGARLARHLLARGASVAVTRRDAGAARALAAALGPGATGVALDLADPSPLVVHARGAVVVCCAPPASDAPDGEAALARAAAVGGAVRVVYVSSTGVYPASPDGAWMDEATEPAPVGAHGIARLRAEQSLLAAAAAAGVEAVALRVAGIYGPGRGVAARMRAGTYRIVGAGDTWVSRIHVDDLVAAIVAAGAVQPLPARVVNVADDEPTTSAALADELARRLGLPPPPRVDAAVDPAAALMLGANRRIANARLVRAFGVALRYPSWRDGLASSLEDE